MKKLIRFISMEEGKKLIKKETDKRLKLAYVLALGSGLRLSEVVGLKKEISKCCDADIRVEEVEV